MFIRILDGYVININKVNCIDLFEDQDGHFLHVEFSGGGYQNKLVPKEKLDDVKEWMLAIGKMGEYERGRNA